jgi:hypothetical protein
MRASAQRKKDLEFLEGLNTAYENKKAASINEAAFEIK